VRSTNASTRPRGARRRGEFRFGAEAAQFGGQPLPGFLAATGNDNAAAFRREARAAARPMPVNAPVIKTTGYFMAMLHRPAGGPHCVEAGVSARLGRGV